MLGTLAPPAFGTALLVRGHCFLAFRKQALGGLTRAELRLLATQTRKDQRTPRRVRAPSIKPGTWLSRTWHDEVHQVVVLDGGFEYRGARYRSLTTIAKRITGAAWSGPRFFGLRSPRLGELGVSRDG